MTTPLLNTVAYDDRAKRWRDSANGQFIPYQSIVDEMRVHQTATYSTLENLTKQLYAGEIPLARWQAGIALELKDAHVALSVFGAGGRANMNQAAFGRVGQTLREQYRFLNDFASDIQKGLVSERQALARIKQYGNAAQQSYYAEYAAQNRNSGKLYYYELHPAEHCIDCIARSAGNPYTYDNLVGYPGDGSTRCRGNDACTLEAR
jgi:hypothetical protein